MNRKTANSRVTAAMRTRTETDKTATMTVTKMPKSLNNPPLKTEANGYNRAKAVEYAYKWWNKRNNEEYGYYSRSWAAAMTAGTTAPTLSPR